jgi:hypothetical protein
MEGTKERRMEKKKAVTATVENNSRMSLCLAYSDVSYSGDEALWGEFSSERVGSDVVPSSDTERASVGGLLHENEGNSFQSKVVPLTETEYPPIGNRPYENDWE